MATFKYLDSLPLTDEEKQKVTSNGYTSPAELYGIVKAVEPHVLVGWLGRDCRAELIAGLEKLLTPEELEELNQPVPEYPICPCNGHRAP